jgi:hypothetical protein
VWSRINYEVEKGATTNLKLLVKIQEVFHFKEAHIAFEKTLKVLLS